MIRKIARPMIASVYIADGADSILNSQERVEQAESLLNRVRALLPRQYARQLPRDPETVVRAVGGAKVGAGATLAIGFMPRASAAVLTAALATASGLLLPGTAHAATTITTNQTGYDGMYYSFYFYGGYAVHGYESVPDYPASHGCLRTFIADQPEIYERIQFGEDIFIW